MVMPTAICIFVFGCDELSKKHGSFLVQAFCNEIDTKGYRILYCSDLLLCNWGRNFICRRDGEWFKDFTP